MASFKNWMLRRFKKSELSDMVNHGVAGGFSGLIYYDETQKLYKSYRDDIWELLSKEADAQGVSIIELISQFKSAKNIQSVAEFENLLVWFSAEKIAWEVIETKNC